MKQELWINLPVKDLVESKKFFSSLGFESLRDVPGMAGFKIGGVPVMMVEHSEFEKYTSSRVSNPANGSELLISVDAPDRNYVEDMVKKVKAAGGKVYSEPEEIQGWMYNMAFIDPDGHHWNILHMDQSKMSKE